MRRCAFLDQTPLCALMAACGSEAALGPDSRTGDSGFDGGVLESGVGASEQSRLDARFFEVDAGTAALDFGVVPSSDASIRTDAGADSGLGELDARPAGASCPAEGATEVLACGVTPLSLAVGSQGVVWFETGVSGCPIRHRALTGAVSTVIDFGCRSRRFEGRVRLALSDGDVFAAISSESLLLIRIPVNGGSEETLWASQTERALIRGLVVDSSAAYLSFIVGEATLGTADFELRRVSRSGGPIEVVAREPSSRFDALDLLGFTFVSGALAADTSSIYWASTSIDSHGLSSWSKTTSELRQVHADPAIRAPLSVDGGRVFFTTRTGTSATGELRWASIEPPPRSNTVTSVSLWASSLAADATHVYWTETLVYLDPFEVASGSLWRAPVDGGPKELVEGGPGKGVTTVGVDNSAIYWLDALEGKVKRRPK